MLRLRRYRIFLVVAVFTVLALYQFSSIGRWSSGSSTGNLERLKSYVGSDEKHNKAGSGTEKQQAPRPAPVPPPPSKQDSKQEPAQAPAPAVPGEELKPAPAPEVEEQARLGPSVLASTSSSATSTSSSIVDSVSVPSTTTTSPPLAPPAAAPHLGQENSGQGEGRLEPESLTISLPPVHWTKFPERYPVPSESVIPLPTAPAVAIPRIQHEPRRESPAEKVEREMRLAAVKEAMNHTWTGYKTHAWLHDELKPLTGKTNDPFCGWAATLVDSLDTLWIMGFEQEFEEAVKAVNQIDFTTSVRENIPMFETTIRYLGGLLGAYDISGGKHRTLLDKAVELAEVLMAAFDTPNRMPMTYYRWKPDAASQPQRAGTKVVLAEIGSLSVEFTRLAQITKEPRYYDAVARITNEFENWQNDTRLPGMWPIAVDASGCKRVYETKGESALPKQGTPQKTITGVKHEGDQRMDEPKHKPVPAALDAAGTTGNAKQKLDKREVGKTAQAQSRKTIESHCEAQGMTSPAHASRETFTLGGQSDSMYEYLPKEHMLLGGVNPQYRSMYEKSIEVVKKHLLFRPMTIDQQDILMSGALEVKGDLDHARLIAEATHLTCFAGGMMGIGSKIFNRPEEMELAEKLVEGCVWAYNATTTGIMPEGFIAVACEDGKSCAWNETRYWDAIDPYYESREKQRQKTMEEEEKRKAERKAYEEKLRKEEEEKEKEMARREDAAKEEQKKKEGEGNKLETRQLGASDASNKEIPKNDKKDANDERGKDGNKKGAEEEATPTTTATEFVYVPPPPLTREQYVKNRIVEERLPPGFVSYESRKYILRPEAIESVFILYRISGDKKWQDKGWGMFEAIQRATRSAIGYHAITDVTSSVPLAMDNMESFWSAETLKYFYLLFSEVGVVSLDDYVFNTEAHPFRRPLHPSSPAS